MGERTERTLRVSGRTTRDPSIDSTAAAVADLRTAEEQIWHSFREIELIGSRAVVVAAQQVVQAVRNITSADYGALAEPTRETLDQQADASAVAAAALALFKTEVRNELGVLDVPADEPHMASGSSVSPGLAGSPPS
jgi:hypothetical protein